jgi:hypothetical protein
VTFTAKDSAPAPTVLVLRLCDCLFRDTDGGGGGGGGGGRAVLGGVTGAALADLIERLGGAPNQFVGAREREFAAPEFAFISPAPPAPSSFHLAEQRRRARARLRSRRSRRSRRLRASPPVRPAGIAPTAAAGVAEVRLDLAELVASKTAAHWQGAHASELRHATSDLAFGVIASHATSAARLPLLRLWWLPGAVGCVSMDRHGAPHAALYALLPSGLELCPVPDHLASKFWMRVGAKNRGLHRGAMMHIITYRRFPDRNWQGHFLGIPKETTLPFLGAVVTE